MPEEFTPTPLERAAELQDGTVLDFQSANEAMKPLALVRAERIALEAAESQYGAIEKAPTIQENIGRVGAVLAEVRQQTIRSDQDLTA